MAARPRSVRAEREFESSDAALTFADYYSRVGAAKVSGPFFGKRVLTPLLHRGRGRDRRETAVAGAGAGGEGQGGCGGPRGEIGGPPGLDIRGFRTLGRSLGGRQGLRGDAADHVTVGRSHLSAAQPAGIDPRSSGNWPLGRERNISEVERPVLCGA